jgi:PREDICTED: hypothetical protein
MKKLVGFIFMLVLSLTLSMTAYAADDLGSIVAKMSTDKKKDKKKKKKKKNKKSKKNKKKAKKGKKKAKKVKKDTQSDLKPSEVVEEVLDDYTSNEEENKDLPVVELRVKSASKIWTNDVDISTINIEKALNELLIGKDGYPSAPDEVIALDRKYRDGGGSNIMIETAAGKSSNYLVKYDDYFYSFKLIAKDCLSCLEVYVEKSDSGSYGLNDFLSTMKVVGLNLDITQKQLDGVAKGEIKARFKAGSVYWDITGDHGTLIFERAGKKFVNFTMSDVFKACAKHRLVFTDNFYSKFSKLMNSDFIEVYIDSSNNYKYNDSTEFEFSSITEGNLGVDYISYVDDAKRRKTKLQIAGNINIDTRVEDLAKILEEYTGIDLYTFDTSRIKNMLIGDSVQEFMVPLERDLGDSHVRISVMNNGERTFQFSVTFTRKY